MTSGIFPGQGAQEKGGADPDHRRVTAVCPAAADRPWHHGILCLFFDHGFIGLSFPSLPLG
ncbi:hypothetical protein OAK97_00155 [bacterium]|nr:hypothetical protein [bacterium]